MIYFSFLEESNSKSKWESTSKLAISNPTALSYEQLSKCGGICGAKHIPQIVERTREVLDKNDKITLDAHQNSYVYATNNKDSIKEESKVISLEFTSYSSLYSSSIPYGFYSQGNSQNLGVTVTARPKFVHIYYPRVCEITNLPSSIGFYFIWTFGVVSKFLGSFK